MDSDEEDAEEQERFVGEFSGLRIVPCAACYKKALLKKEKIEQDLASQSRIIAKYGKTNPNLKERVKAETGEDWICTNSMEPSIGNCVSCLKAGPLDEPCDGCQGTNIVIFWTAEKMMINPRVISKYAKKDVKERSEPLPRETRIEKRFLQHNDFGDQLETHQEHADICDIIYTC
jgi:hypothetical protein